MLVGVKVVLSIIFLVVFGAIGYKTAEWYFRSDVKEEYMVELHELIKKQKQLKKNREVDLAQFEKDRHHCEQRYAAD